MPFFQQTTYFLRGPIALALLVAALNGAQAASAAATNAKPDWLHVVRQHHLDGKHDDLLTSASAGRRPSGQPDTADYADAWHPSAAELRRAALARPQDRASGEGVFYARPAHSGDGRIPGVEILAYADDGRHDQNVAMLLAVPDSINWREPCVLAVPISGSGRLYSALDVQIRGGWGLKRGCAVVYTDKGQGNGVHDLTRNAVMLIDGLTVPAERAGHLAHFVAPLGEKQRNDFLRRYPFRLAFKHAYSRQNSDASWGRDVVRSIEFALWQLNQMKPTRANMLCAENTTVLVYGESNGGGAALKAGEADAQGLIDGILASEPQIQPQASAQIAIAHAGRIWSGGGKSLLDYFTWGILWQPCALIATPDAPLAGKVTFAANRCRSLREKGLLQADTLEEQGKEALGKLHDYGWEAGTDAQQAFSFIIAPAATANKYASAQGRFGVEDRLCGYSLAWSDAQGRPAPMPGADWAELWVKAPGGAPSGNIDLINDNDPRGPRRDGISISPSSGRQDYNLDGALCMRELVTGDSANARRVQEGIAEIRATGNLHRIPTLIVHGRDDARVPVNFSSRPYLALNNLVEGEHSRLRYIEVTNAGHFGASAPFDHLLVPLNFYAEQAMDLMWAHLKQRQPLPDSQVIHTVPRGGNPGQAPALSRANLPQIALHAAAERQISVRQGRVEVPE